MKTTLKFFTFAAVLFGFASISFAQTQIVEQATADAKVTIVQPIAIELTEGTELNFGNLAATNSSYEVTITFAGVRNAPAAAIVSPPGTHNVPEFTVTGFGNSTYKVTVPESPVTLTNLTGTGSETMTLTDFDHNATEQLTNGEEKFTVIATLNVGANQVAGDYKGSFPVTVNYN